MTSSHSPRGGLFYGRSYSRAAVGACKTCASPQLALIPFDPRVCARAFSTCVLDRCGRPWWSNDLSDFEACARIKQATRLLLLIMRPASLKREGGRKRLIFESDTSAQTPSPPPSPGEIDAAAGSTITATDNQGPSTHLEITQRAQQQRDAEEEPSKALLLSDMGMDEILDGLPSYTMPQQPLSQ